MKKRKIIFILAMTLIICLTSIPIVSASEAANETITSEEVGKMLADLFEKYGDGAMSIIDTEEGQIYNRQEFMEQYTTLEQSLMKSYNTSSVEVFVNEYGEYSVSYLEKDRDEAEQILAELRLEAKVNMQEVSETDYVNNSGLIEPPLALATTATHYVNSSTMSFGNVGSGTVRASYRLTTRHDSSTFPYDWFTGASYYTKVWTYSGIGQATVSLFDYEISYGYSGYYKTIVYTYVAYEYEIVYTIAGTTFTEHNYVNANNTYYIIHYS